MRLAVLMFAFFVLSTPHWLVMTLTTLRLAERGYDALPVGLFAALPWLTILSVSPWIARLTRRIGERFLPAAALLMESLAVAGFAMHESIAWWLGCQVLMGIGGAVLWVFAEGWVPAMTPPACQGRVRGIYESIAGLAIMVGPGLVTWAITMGDLPFYAVIATYAVGGLIVLAVQPPIIGVASAVAPKASPHRRTWWVYAGLMLPAFVGGFFEAGASSVLPLAGLSVGLNVGAAALLVTVLGVGSFAAQWPLGALADRFDVQRMIRWCVMIAVGTALLWALAMSMQWSFALWPVAVAWGSLGGGVYTLTMVRLGRSFRGADLLPASSAVVFAYTLGTALSPAINGLALDHRPESVPLVFATVAALGLWGLSRRTRTTTPMPTIGQLIAT
jgi:MFS family permease